MKTAFKSTFRNFVRKPTITLINLLGLAISLALVINLSAYCYSEFTTDDFHKNGDMVYLYGSKEFFFTPAILKEQIDLNVPAVEATVRTAGMWEAPVFQVGDNEPITSDLIFADQDFFKLFTYNAIEGDLESALKEPQTVVITKSLSKKLFGKGEAIGKTMKMNNNLNLTIKAIIDEPKGNSTLSFSAVTSVATRKIFRPGREEEFTNWEWQNFQTFVLLKKGVNPKEAEKSILSQFPKDNQKDHADAMLIPFKKLYFSQNKLFNFNYLHQGDKDKALFYLLIAILILLIAVVNFINISSSQWLEKIRQTGIMKVVGASRSTVLFHVIFEAFIFFLVSLLIAILLNSITAPFISNYTGIHFNQRLTYTPSFLMISIAGIFALSMTFRLIAALRISSSNAIDNISRRIEPHTTNSIFRGILVAAQFTIAIILIAFTILVQKQVKFGSSNLGFNQENIIGIGLTPELNKKKEVLKNLLSDKQAVKKTSFTDYYPPGQRISHLGRIPLTQNGEKKQLEFDIFSADAGFFEMMGLKLVMGRFYSDNLSTEAGKIVVNEAFVREHQLADPIGSNIPGMDDRPMEIIGVVKDFHYKPFYQPIAPLVIQNEQGSAYCLVSLQTGDFNSLHNTIQSIKTATNNLSPSFPVEINFLDQAVENMYQSELQFRRTFSLFAGCAIVVCCLGIFAMSLFACQRRIKEIGVRKINGAKVSEVLATLNKDFVKWVVIALVIATPIAWYMMQKWLEHFAYKTSLSWWIFALAGAIAMAIALLTVSWQSWKAATRNPVEALRYE